MIIIKFWHIKLIFCVALRCAPSLVLVCGLHSCTGSSGSVRIFATTILFSFAVFLQRTYVTCAAAFFWSNCMKLHYRVFFAVH